MPPTVLTENSRECPQAAPGSPLTTSGEGAPASLGRWMPAPGSLTAAGWVSLMPMTEKEFTAW